MTAADWAATAQWFEMQAKVKTAHYELATAVQRETDAVVEVALDEEMGELRRDASQSMESLRLWKFNRFHLA